MAMLMEFIFKTRLINATSKVVLVACFSLNSLTVVAQESNMMGDWGGEEEGLLMMYGDEEVLSLATGYTQLAAKAPAVATVITSDDIRAMGSTTVAEALKSVPGLHVSSNYQGAAPVYTFRGIYSVFNPQVLIMINSVPINALFVGSPSISWGGMPVEGISRIEVIRGPGSAIYGADAVAGVINIVTKVASEIQGIEVGGRIGSYATRDAWFAYGDNRGDRDISFVMEYRETDGHQSTIEADAQSFFDNLEATSASYAPGGANTSTQNLDMRFDYSSGLWQVRAGLQDRRNVGSYVGPAQVLDPTNKWARESRNLDITWHDPNFSEKWDLKNQVSYYSTNQHIYKDHYLHIYAPGSSVDLTGDSVGDGPWPDGLIGNPEHYERHFRYEFTAAYDGLEDHKLRFGIGYHHGEIYKIEETRNFGVNPATSLPTLPLTPGSPIFSVTDTSFVFMEEGARRNKHLYAQDIVKLSNDLELTVGLRHDDYSDYGSTLNPRAALVWAASYDLNFKLLYGEAYRGPSFSESRAQNNPAALGNSDLEPEKIKTWEFALDYIPLDAPHLQLGFFHYDWNNIIQFIQDPAPSTTIRAQNYGQQRGYGVEFAADWVMTEQLRLQGNYSWLRAENLNTNTHSGNAPNQQAYLMLAWEFVSDWHFSGQANYISERKRPEGDARAPLDGYTTVDVTLRRTHLNYGWEVAGSVRNLFDADVREPSPSANFLPNDMPQAGRNLYAELRYKY